MCFSFSAVIAMDIDPIKIELAKHNAAIYGVLDRIEFRVGDFLASTDVPDFKADVVFMSPPWGGPQYTKLKHFDVQSDMPLSGCDLMRRSLEFADTVVMFLPRNSRPEQLAQMAAMCGDKAKRELRISYDMCPLTKRMPGLTAFMGDVSKLQLDGVRDAATAVKSAEMATTTTTTSSRMICRRMTMAGTAAMAEARRRVLELTTAESISAKYVPPHLRMSTTATAAMAAAPAVRMQRRYTMNAADKISRPRFTPIYRSKGVPACL